MCFMRHTSLFFAALVVSASGSDGMIDFYDAISGNNVEKVVNMFTDDGVYIHTGMKLARGTEQLRSLFQAIFDLGAVPATTSLVLVDEQVSVPPTEFADIGEAAALIFTRRANVGKVRDTLFVEQGKIKSMMTTMASKDDPVSPSSVKPTAHKRDDKSAAAGTTKYRREQRNVAKTVDKYFEAFGKLQARGMLSSFGKRDSKGGQDPFYMVDFRPEVRTPFGCATSEDCSTAPYINKRKELLTAFEGFCHGYVNINRTVDEVRVWGELALASTASNGCSGDELTPEGSAPMPHREMIVLLKHKSTWKIHSFTSTYDLASPLKGPVDECEKEPNCITEGAAGKCFMGFGCPDNSACYDGICICNQDMCTYDGKHCQPTPTTTTTTSTVTTSTLTVTTTTVTTTTTLVCDRNASVGECLEVGCFADHGSAHCDETTCVCDEGSCSQDGWTCIPDPSLLLQRLIEPPREVTLNQQHFRQNIQEGGNSMIGAFVGVALLVSIAMVLTFSRRLGSNPILQPLLQ